MSVHVELVADHKGQHWQIRRNPTCTMLMPEPFPLQPCGAPATVRVRRMPYWTMMWCPQHAEDLAGVKSTTSRFIGR